MFKEGGKMGFSYIGMVIVILILPPSIIFTIKFPPKNQPISNAKVGLIFTILEKTGQALCLAILIMSEDNFKEAQFNIFMPLMSSCIAIYYCLWFRYIRGGQEFSLLSKPLFFIPVPLAIFPVCAFGFAALWIESFWLLMSTLILAIGHITVSWQSIKI